MIKGIDARVELDGSGAVGRKGAKIPDQDAAIVEAWLCIGIQELNIEQDVGEPGLAGVYGQLVAVNGEKRPVVVRTLIAAHPVNDRPSLLQLIFDPLAPFVVRLLF